jgi:hypothetical protein
LNNPKHHLGQEPQKIVNRHQETLKAILKYLKLGGFDAARSFYEEAIAGNKVAQYIVAAALHKAGRNEAAKVWFDLSAAQGFEPRTGKAGTGGVYLDMLSIKGDLPGFLQFVHRENTDGTIASICGYCGRTVLTSSDRSKIKEAEASHACANRD